MPVCLLGRGVSRLKLAAKSKGSPDGINGHFTVNHGERTSADVFIWREMSFVRFTLASKSAQEGTLLQLSTQKCEEELIRFSVVQRTHQILRLLILMCYQINEVISFIIVLYFCPTSTFQGRQIRLLSLQISKSNCILFFLF